MQQFGQHYTTKQKNDLRALLEPRKSVPASAGISRAPKFQIPDGSTWAGTGRQPKAFLAWAETAEGKAWKEAPGPGMAGAPVQGLIAIERCRHSPGKPGFLWALKSREGKAGLGREPRPMSQPSPEGLSGAAQAAFFDLLKRKSNAKIKSGSNQKRCVEKGREGLGFRRARRLAGKCAALQVLQRFAAILAVLIFSR